MTAIFGVAILVFATAVIAGDVAGAAIAGMLAAAIAAGVYGLAWGLRWGLPAGRRGPWPLALAIAAVVFVAAEFVVARWLALRFRDPALVGLVAAAAGVVLAWGCVAVVVPVVVRVSRWCEGRTTSPRTLWAVRGLGLVVVLGGVLALGLQPQRRLELTRAITGGERPR